MLDETFGIQGISQLATMLKYINDVGIQERCLGFTF